MVPLGVLGLSRLIVCETRYEMGQSGLQDLPQSIPPMTSPAAPTPTAQELRLDRRRHPDLVAFGPIDPPSVEMLHVLDGETSTGGPKYLTMFSMLFQSGRAGVDSLANLSGL